MKRNLSRGKVICAVSGLAVLLMVIASGAAYPNPVFRVGAPLGLGLIALALVLMAADWGWDLRNAIRQRQGTEILILLIGAAVTVGAFFFHR